MPINWADQWRDPYEDEPDLGNWAPPSPPQHTPPAQNSSPWEGPDMPDWAPDSGLPDWAPDGDLPDWYDPGTGQVGGDTSGDVFEVPGYSGPGAPSFNFEDVPEFNPTRFNAPSLADAQNEPGFQFRLQSGTDALERSAAAKGTLRTGGTLKDIVSYGQNFAAQEYHNVFNRALQAYGVQYQAEKDQYAPLFAEWQFGVNAEHDAQMAAFQREWDAYALSVEAALRREQMIQNAMMPPPPSDYQGA